MSCEVMGLTGTGCEAHGVTSTARDHRLTRRRVASADGLKVTGMEG